MVLFRCEPCTSQQVASRRCGTSPTASIGVRWRPSSSPRPSGGASSRPPWHVRTVPSVPARCNCSSRPTTKSTTSPSDEGSRSAELRTICAFDIVANNADRKSGHVLMGSDQRLWGIDHGLCFHRQHKLRTVIWDFVGEEVPEGILVDLARLGSSLPEALDELLSEAEREAILGRITALLRAGRFPEPTGDRPPYPWPLV